MKKNFFSIKAAVALWAALCSLSLSATTWNFGNLTQTDITNLNADPSAWT